MSFKRFSRFLLESYGHKVCESDQGEFLNSWYLLVIVSDLMTIIGSILKIEIQAKVSVNVLTLMHVVFLTLDL